MENMVNPDPRFWAGKKVLVTGHTGFKGAWLSLWLHKLGAKVTGVALPPEGPENLFSLLQLDKKIQSEIVDVRNFDSLQATIKKHEPEIVFHMAAQALVRLSYADPVGTYATNVMGTVHLLESLRLNPSARVIVNVTSDKCYENVERAWGYREDEPMGGHDPYSNSKGCSELVTAAYRKSFFQDSKTQLSSARAGNVIGGGDWAKDRLVPDILNAISTGKKVRLRNPNSIRPWQFVLEPLSGYLALAEKSWTVDSKYSKGYNFGPKESDAQTVEWVIEEMGRLSGKTNLWERAEGKLLHEAQYLKLDCTLAKAELNWESRSTLNQTLKWILEWHQEYEAHRSIEAICLKQISDFENLR